MVPIFLHCYSSSTVVLHIFNEAAREETRALSHEDHFLTCPNMLFSEKTKLSCLTAVSCHEGALNMVKGRFQFCLSQQNDLVVYENQLNSGAVKSWWSSLQPVQFFWHYGFWESVLYRNLATKQKQSIRFLIIILNKLKFWKDATTARKQNFNSP